MAADSIESPCVFSRRLAGVGLNSLLPTTPPQAAKRLEPPLTVITVKAAAKKGGTTGPTNAGHYEQLCLSRSCVKRKRKAPSSRSLVPERDAGQTRLRPSIALRAQALPSQGPRFPGLLPHVRAALFP